MSAPRSLLTALLLLPLVASCKDEGSSSADKADSSDEPTKAKKKDEEKEKDDGGDGAKDEGGDGWKAKKQAEAEELPEALSLDKDNDEGEAPAIKVMLPPKPTYPADAIPNVHPDGSWSVAGVRSELDKHVEDGDKGAEITLTAYVQEIYVPPECPEGEACPPPKQAHVWVADSPDHKGKRLAMVVVNYVFPVPEWDAKRWKDQPEVVLEKGTQYLFKGKVRRFSDTGFADRRGLLEFVAYRTTDETGVERWVYPPNSPWHPLEILRQEEANAALAEKADAAARKGR